MGRSVHDRDAVYANLKASSVHDRDAVYANLKASGYVEYNNRFSHRFPACYTTLVIMLHKLGISVLHAFSSHITGRMNSLVRGTLLRIISERLEPFRTGFSLLFSKGKHAFQRCFARRLREDVVGSSVQELLLIVQGSISTVTRGYGQPTDNSITNSANEKLTSRHRPAEIDKGHRSLSAP